MFNIEFHCGADVENRTPILRETNADPCMEAVLASAKTHAVALGAKNIVIKNDAGRVVGVFSTFDYDMD